MTNETFAESRTGPAPFTLSSSRTGDRHLLSLSGELDVATAAGLEAELRRIEAGDADTIVVDLSRLTFIEPVGIGLLVHGDRRSRSNGKRFALVEPVPGVLRVFEICRIADRLSFQ